MSNFKIPRRAFIRGAVAGAAGFAFGVDAVAEVLAGPDSISGPEKFGLPDYWNEGAMIGLDQAGNLVVAWTAYKQQSEDIFVIRYQNGKPLPPEKITDNPHPDFSPVVTSDPHGGFWVFWVRIQKQDSRIVGRRFSDGRWHEETYVSSPGGPCFHPSATSSQDGVHLAWERLDEGIPEIWFTSLIGGRWRAGRMVAYGSNPSLSAVGSGPVWLAWQSAESGRYEIFSSNLNGSGWSEPEKVASGNAHYRHASTAATPDGEVWLTCEGMVPTQTRNDRERDYRFDDMCYLPPLSDCTFRRTSSGWQKAPADDVRRQALRPRIIPDGERIWVLYYLREASLGGARKFKTMVTGIENGKWGGDFDFSTLIGHGLKMPHAAVIKNGRLYTAIQSDVRARVNDPCWTYADGRSDISVCSLAAVPTEVLGAAARVAEHAPFYANPDHIPSPTYSTRVSGKELELYFGDLHKHSEISLCGRLDGEIVENYEYSRDIRKLDFMQSTDHSEHQNEQDWFETRKYSSFFNCDGVFVAFSGYEWTSEFRSGENLNEGHYNPTFLADSDNMLCLSASIKESNTPRKLWRLLEDSLQEGDDVLTIAHHTSRWKAPLRWEYYDPRMGHLIEIAQARGSYEYFGCPDTSLVYNDTRRVRGHMFQDGLARGYKYGVIAAGDHGGSCLAGVYAPDLSRREIFYALKNRRCYGTNGPKMVVDFRVDDHFMGESFDSESDRHTIKVFAQGRSIERVDIWKDGRIIFTERGSGRDSVALTYEDRIRPDRRDSYYYVRVIQEGTGIAWSSPIWVRHTHVDPQVILYVDDKEVETVAPSAVVRLPLVIRNEHPTPVTARLMVEVQPGWSANWEERRARVRQNWWTEEIVELTAPDQARRHPYRVSITMRADDRRWESTVRFVVTDAT